jgi:hypothetical protein
VLSNAGKDGKIVYLPILLGIFYFHSRSLEWSLEEEIDLLEAYKNLGNKWTKLSSKFPGRSANMIKNKINSFIKKELNSISTNVKQNTIDQGIKSHMLDPAYENTALVESLIKQKKKELLASQEFSSNGNNNSNLEENKSDHQGIPTQQYNGESEGPYLFKQTYHQDISMQGYFSKMHLFIGNPMNDGDFDPDHFDEFSNCSKSLLDYN